MADDDLYQQAIIALAKSQTGGGRLDAPDASATIYNPLCGDRVTVDLTLADGKVTAVGHKVRGCALCEAAAAAIGKHAIDQTEGDLRAVAQSVADILKGERDAAAAPWPDLAAFTPVTAHKSRHDCVLLPFQALTKALDEVRR